MSNQGLAKHYNSKHPKQQIVYCGRKLIKNLWSEVDVKSFSDGRFRIVFELWVYDQESGEFVFGWYSKDEFYSASIYMWFELNLYV